MSYAPVATEPVELAEVSLDGDLRDSAAAASAASPDGSSRPSLTKRPIYSAHRVESRTPRVPGETDDAFKRRVNVAYVNALLHSVAWVAAALLILYYTDMWNIVRYDTRINQSEAQRRHSRTRRNRRAQTEAHESVGLASIEDG